MESRTTTTPKGYNFDLQNVGIGRVDHGKSLGGQREITFHLTHMKE